MVHVCYSSLEQILGKMIGTGYVERGQWTQDFAKLWYENLLRYAPKIKSIVVICAGCDYPIESDHITVVRGQNLGHVREYIEKHREGRFCGWSASVIALATIAYNLGEDLIFLEQDCLAFGPWLEQAYKDMGDGEFVFGGPHKKPPYMQCSQSLFIIRHSFLMDFLSAYLSLPEDAIMLSEEKFLRIYEKYPERCRHLSFGCDRERPIPFEAPVFYCQQLNGPEIDRLKELKLC